jgi:hypothetical protein
MVRTMLFGRFAGDGRRGPSREARGNGNERS